MPKDKLDTQWSEDDHSQASSYTSDQQSTYKSQSQPGNRPAGNRTKPDYATQVQPAPYKAYVKPEQPPCDGRQFSENPYMSGDNYLSVPYDKWGNERPKDMPMHNSGEYGDPGSIYGGRNGQDFNFTGGQTYGNQIPHGSSAAFNNPATTWVDNSKANRGPEYVEGNSDSGISGPSSPPYDNNNVAQGNTPPIISYLNSIRGRK